MALQANDYATIVKLLPYLQRGGTAIGSSLGKNASLGQTLSSPGLLSGIGGMLGAGLGGKYAPLTSGIGGVGGSLLGSLINKAPINTTSIGGGLGGALGSYLGGNYGKLGSVIGSGLGNIGGQVLTGALFPSSATGVLGGVGSGITGLLTGLFGSKLGSSAQGGMSLISPYLTKAVSSIATPALNTIGNAVGLGTNVAGQTSSLASALGGVSAWAAPVASALTIAYSMWQDAKQEAKWNKKNRATRTELTEKLMSPETQSAASSMRSATENEGLKRLSIMKQQGLNPADYDLDPSTGLHPREKYYMYENIGQEDQYSDPEAQMMANLLGVYPRYPLNSIGGGTSGNDPFNSLYEMSSGITSRLSDKNASLGTLGGDLYDRLYKNQLNQVLGNPGSAARSWSSGMTAADWRAIEVADKENEAEKLRMLGGGR